jgi:5'-3' exonuclease
LKGGKRRRLTEKRPKKQVGCPIVAIYPRSQLIISAGTTEDVERFTRRTVKVTREHNEECRRLLKLMGIPVIIV